MGTMNHVIGGGTISHVRNHLALSARAYGTAARQLHEILLKRGEDSTLHLTRMADPQNSKIETTEHLRVLADEIVADPLTKIIFFNAAVPEDGQIGDIPSGQYAERLQSRNMDGAFIQLSPAPKILKSIREKRKDVFLVAFKATAGVSEDEQYQQALRMMKQNHVNLVLANDTVTRKNMIVAPEEARYHITTDREEALSSLVDMALARSGLHYTRSTVLDGDLIPWNSNMVPENLRQVVDFCISEGAYKPFLGKTAGHFAARGPRPGTFLTSVRGSNFNELANAGKGLVLVEAEDDDTVIAHGARPSVGGQSQRIVFGDHPDLDNIVHFHVPLKEGSLINVRDQRPFECGSHECGRNTSQGLKEIADGVFAVMLDNHGPTIVFGNEVPADRVINAIRENFDLSQKTGGTFAPEYAVA